MGTRSFQVRLLATNAELELLWLTHVEFHARLRATSKLLRKMARGKVGRDDNERRCYREFADWLLDPERTVQDVDDKLNWVARIQGGKERKADSRLHGAPDGLEERLRDLQRRQCYAIDDKKTLYADLPGALGKAAANGAKAHYKAWREQVIRWEREYSEWRTRKETWENEHSEYMTVHDRFEQFEEEFGQLTGRVKRWPKYCAWLKSNSDLVQWKDKSATAAVHDLPPQARERVRKAPAKKRAGLEVDEFFAVNPELRELDKLRQFYHENFRRGWKVYEADGKRRRRRIVGFKRRPTFTEPEATKHPYWLTFKATRNTTQGSYRKLVLRPRSPGSIELYIVPSAGRRIQAKKGQGNLVTEWRKFQFHGDPRLSDFFEVPIKRKVRQGRNKGGEEEGVGYQWHDRQLGGRDRNASVSGAKLVFRLNHDRKPHAAYLYFTCNVADEPWTENASTVKPSGSTAQGQRGAHETPEGLVVCAVDLGIRNTAFGVIGSRDPHSRSGVRVLRVRNLWTGHEELEGAHPQRWNRGPDLRAVNAHGWNLRQRRRARGKPVRGEASHIELQAHITHSRENRYKEAARKIVNFALNVHKDKSKSDGEYPRADVLVIEDLKSLHPEDKRERGINRALASFNRGHLIEFLKGPPAPKGDKKRGRKAPRGLAGDAGLRVREVWPNGTSQVCAQCGGLGRRYAVAVKHEAGKPAAKYIRFGNGEALFACDNERCLTVDKETNRPKRRVRSVNSDYNAAVNLLRRFFYGDAATISYEEFRRAPETERKSVLRALELRLCPLLEEVHGLRSAADPEADDIQL